MALYELKTDGLEPIAQTTFTALGLQERANIQKAVRQHIGAITPGVRTMVLAEEFGDWIDANRRIDLLCLDDAAKLVVVELKRDNSGHMELQALRYAAMVSTMRFDQAVEAHRKYLRSIGAAVDAEQSIREFLDAEEGPIALSGIVRIVLASSEFSTELTTAVLWLNDQGLDVRCVQMSPHHVEGRVLLDIQQVIPLPAAEQYQVALREKAQAAARSQTRDTTRYDLRIGDSTLVNLPKRKLIFEVVAEAIRRGVTPDQVAAAVPWRENSIFYSVAGKQDEAGFLAASNGKSSDRYCSADEELFHVNDKTYALTSQWGHRTLEAVGKVLAVMPSGPEIEYMATAPIVDEVAYGELVVRRRENGTIEVAKNGVPIQPVKPMLREIANSLNVPLQNERGNDMNTQQLGVKLIRAIGSQ